MSEQKKSGVSVFVNKHILPPVMKFVNTKAIQALQNGMIYTLPFILIGSIFLILGNIPIKSVADAINASGWGAFFNQAYTTTFSIMAMWASVGIAYIYVKNEGYEPLAPGLTSLAAFLMLQTLTIDSPLKNAMAKGIDGQMTAKAVTENIDKLPHALQSFLESPVTGVFNITWLGGDGMIAAIIVGLLVGWIYSAIMKKGWTIKLPEQVPAAVSNQFTAMIPSGIILIGTMLIYAGFKLTTGSDFLQWTYQTLQIPLQGISDSLGGAIAIGFLVPFFWFFGVHGGLIVGSLAGPMLQANSFDNAQLYKAGKLTIANGAHVVTNEFYNNFINLTGSGITIGLTPVVVAISTYFVIKTGIVPPLNGFACPWTMPAVISGFLIGGWKMAIWQACTLVISTLIYWPFAKKYDNILVKREAAALKKDEAEGK